MKNGFSLLIGNVINILHSERSDHSSFFILFTYASFLHK